VLHAENRLNEQSGLSSVLTGQCRGHQQWRRKDFGRLGATALFPPPQPPPVALPFLNVWHITVLRTNSNSDVKKFIIQFHRHCLFINALIEEIVNKIFWGRLYGAPTLMAPGHWRRHGFESGGLNSGTKPEVDNLSLSGCVTF
jgi:hypothetical protein